MNRPMKFDDLKQFLSVDALLLSEEAQCVYECDALSAHRVMPGCVVLAETVEQVQAIFTLLPCTKYPNRCTWRRNRAVWWCNAA